MKQVLFAIILLGVLASCRSSRAIGKAVGPKDSTIVAVNRASDSLRTDSLRFIAGLKSQLEKNRINFTTFNAKIGVDYRGADGRNRDVNANIRMYRDSAIWVSVNAVLGIEAIRLLITRDSVKLLNKLEKTYAARGISFLQETSSLPLDLPTLQALIIGNPVYLDSNIVRYETGLNTVSLVSIGTLFRNLLTLQTTDKWLLESRLTDTDPLRNRTADLTYRDYETKKGPPFATRREIIVAEKNRLEVRLDFKNYEFEQEVSFPFNVPKNYERL